jgi:ElaB/YqjD/DUF883 family membrane-anchored ribosome-binding protein
MSDRNVEQEFDALKSDLGKIGSDLASLTQAIHDFIGQDTQAKLDKLHGATEQAKEEVGTAAAALGERGCKGISSIGNQLRKHPLVSVLIGLAVGVVLGKLFFS